MDGLERVLDAARGGFDTLIKVNVYLASLDDFAAFKVCRRRVCPNGLPPRTTVEIVRFPPPMRIEVDVAGLPVMQKARREDAPWNSRFGSCVPALSPG